MRREEVQWKRESRTKEVGRGEMSIKSVRRAGEKKSRRKGNREEMTGHGLREVKSTGRMVDRPIRDRNVVTKRMERDVEYYVFGT